MADFMEVLNKPAAEIEKPKPRPVGTYLAQITGLPDQVERKDNKILSFKCKLLASQGDVDAEKLQEQPELSTWPPMKHDIFINELYPLKRFLTEVLGIDAGPEDDSKTLSQMIAEAPGKQLMVNVQHRPYMSADNQPEIASEIKSVAHV